MDSEIVELAENVAKMSLVSDHSRSDVGYQGESSVAQLAGQLQGLGHPIVGRAGDGHLRSGRDM